MNALRRFSRLLLVLLAVGATRLPGEVAVEIVNMPAEVHSFGPAYVLYSVENTGREPVYLPAEGAPDLGPGVYLAPRGETPSPTPGPVPDRMFSHSLRNMWLAPGEQWFFYEDVGPRLGVLEGEISVQAVMSSRGRCGGTLTYGRQSFPTEPLYIETVEVGLRRADVFRCWEGEVRSSVWKLTVVRPEGPVEAAALDYLQERGGLLRDLETDAWRLKWVSSFRDEYPSSHYTYALFASAGSSVHSKELAVRIQPDNPLNPWVLGAIAREVLDHRSSCWEGRPLGFELSIEDLELPAGVREYLDQYAWYLEHRYCPRVREAAEAEKGGRP